MDFDDLDDAIDQRIAEGNIDDLAHLGGAAVVKELKQFVPTEGMTPIPRDHRLPADPGAIERMSDPNAGRIFIRAFVFYGPGGSAQALFGPLATMPIWVECAVYEWPGHGTRWEEPRAADLEELAEDAFQALKPAMEEVKEDGPMEGAPFVFIGQSVGCQILTCIAKKLKLLYGLVPSFVAVMDRAPLQFPLLSEEGQKMLETDPDEVLSGYDLERFGQVDKEMLAKDLSYASETRDPFFHKFDCDLMLLKATRHKELNTLGAASKYTMATMKINGTDETFSLPVEQGTSVGKFRACIAGIFANKVDAKLTVTNKKGVELKDEDIIPEFMTFEGLDDFTHPKYPWPHPIAIIGAGFQGIKFGMQYMTHKNANFVLFDRHSNAGGDAWHNAATKHSKIQTDFGAFNIWWGHEYTYTGECGFGASPQSGGRAQFARPSVGTLGPTGAGTDVDYHPIRMQVLNEMQFAAEEYGFLHQIHFESQVEKIQIVGGEEDHDRYYKFTVKDLSAKRGPDLSLRISLLYHFPGAYDINRQITYPGESEFGGQIGYGMGHIGQGAQGPFIWDDGKMKGARNAILGNGAFSIENVRSCAEFGASKVYLVTRRRSLACPRVPCWFCHQGPFPTPAWHLLDMFKPMYSLAGLGDPYDFYAVSVTGPKNVLISQGSRFGIGDVTFICAAYGILEYKLDTLARCTRKTLHLTSGEKLENVDNIIKALGLLGDPRVDKLHEMTHRVGAMINGDWRRVISADATGMHASNFTTFSAGPGACSNAKQWYYLHQRPWDMYAALADGMMKVIPVHKMSTTQPDQTVYMTNVQYEMAAGGIFGRYFPGMGRCFGDENCYKYCLLHSMHPTDKFLEYCSADWDRYQNLFKELGHEHEYIPYPYTKEMVEEFYRIYNENFPGMDAFHSPAGPTEDFKKQTLQSFKDLVHGLNMELRYQLVTESKLHEHMVPGTDVWGLGNAGYMYQRRATLMASAPDSALDFDEDKCAEWQMWMAGDCTYTEEEIEAKSIEILYNPQTWEKMVPKIYAKSSQHNLP